MPKLVSPEDVPESPRGRPSPWRDYVNAGWVMFTPTEDFEGDPKKFQRRAHSAVRYLTKSTGRVHHAETRISSETGAVYVRLYTEPVQ